MTLLVLPGASRNRNILPFTSHDSVAPLIEQLPTYVALLECHHNM